jgi:hypothetical protein
MSGFRTLDLNIFYREEWTKETGTTYSSDFLIEPYVYESDAHGTRKYDTGIIIECDAYETAFLAEQFPESEYGFDFWIFRDEVEMPSRRIAKILGAIDIDRNRQEPNMVVSFEPSTM